MRKYVVVTEVVHPVRVTVPDDADFRDPYPYNRRFPPDPAITVDVPGIVMEEGR